ncbi:MAG: hypothetical protein PsegKO_06950 [Pseudohongiellaceae bacterium]
MTLTPTTQKQDPEARTPLNPEQIQEYLFYALASVFPIAFVTNLTYNLVIRGFFVELAEQDRQAWEKLGSPSKNAKFKPIDSSNVRMLAFVPVLRAKAALPDYPESQRAWRWFKAAAAATSTLFLLAAILVVWSLANDLY